MTREADPAARRVTIEIGEQSRVVVDRFDDYNELVEAHIYWDPGVRAQGYALDIGEMVEEHAVLERAVMNARWSAELLMTKFADQLAPYAQNPPRDVDELTERFIRGIFEGRDPASIRSAEMDVAARSRRGRQALPLEELRKIVAYWDEIYDDHLGDEAGRRAAVAKRFGLGVRRLGDALAQARRAGLRYRGMRG